MGSSFADRTADSAASLGHSFFEGRGSRQFPGSARDLQNVNRQTVTAVLAVDDGAGGTMHFRRFVSMHVDSVGPPALRGPVGG